MIEIIALAIEGTLIATVLIMAVRLLWGEIKRGGE